MAQSEIAGAPGGALILGEADLKVRWTTLAALILFGGYVAMLALSSFSHNDFMYAAAATRDGRLYQDIHFVQGPIAFWFWRLVALAAPKGAIYLTLRSVSAALTIGAVAIASCSLVRVTSLRPLFVLAAAASYVPIAAGEIGSYSLPLFLVVCGLALILSPGRAMPGLLLAGGLFGLAAGAKTNYVLLAPPVLAWIFISSRALNGLRRAITEALAFGAGMALGLAPTLYYAATEWQAFVFHNLAFHSELTNRARGIDLSGSMKSMAKGLRAFFLVHAIVIGPAVWLLVRSFRPIVAFWLTLGVTALVMACTPMVLYPQYLIPASLFFVVAFVESLAPLQGRLRAVLIWSTAVVLALIDFHGAASAGLRIRADGLPPLTIERDADALRSFSARVDSRQAGCTPELFTFAGAIAVDSGFQLAPYTEAGYFWARLKGFVPTRYYRDPAYHFDRRLVSPVDWARSAGVDFLLLGYYPKEEAALAAYADQQSFESASLPALAGHELVLRYRPRCLSEGPSRPRSPAP